MGGLTLIKLKDVSELNIAKHNALLRTFGLPKKYKFYSELDTKNEYAAYVDGEGTFPEHLFPKDKIKSYEDFKKYWSTKNLGETFVPAYGTLAFDCYFGRTSDTAMHNLGKYIYANWEDIKSTGGSFETFMERGMSKKQREYIIGETGSKIKI